MELKLYILLKDTCPDNLAPLIAAHTTMRMYMTFRHFQLTQDWADSPHFKKVICRVSPEVFEKAKEYGDHITMSEVHHDPLGELGMAFNIQSEYPKFFKFLPLWRTSA